MKAWVGPPGIEPGLYAPEAHVLPVYYGPTQAFIPARTYYRYAIPTSEAHRIDSMLSILCRRTRTAYALHTARQKALPVCALQDSNLLPFACEANALTR